MKTRVSVWMIGFVCLFLMCDSVEAQGYHRLTSRDFAGSPIDNGFLAYTNCYVSYTYQTTRHNGIYNIDFDIRLALNTDRSWIRFNQVKSREMLADILKHEQAHYNIAYLMKNELYSVFNRPRYSANYQQEIAVLFHQVESKYHKLNDDYENQTQHMADTGNQQKWNNWFSSQLSNAEIVDINNPVARNNNQFQ